MPGGATTFAEDPQVQKWIAACQARPAYVEMAAERNAEPIRAPIGNARHVVICLKWPILRGEFSRFASRASLRSGTRS